VEPSETDTRPDLFDLWKKHHFHTWALAFIADVPEQTILTMLRRRPVVRADAVKVLSRLSQLMDQNYTLETVKVNLQEET
jgi:hypothetical protein